MAEPNQNAGIVQLRSGIARGRGTPSSSPLPSPPQAGWRGTDKQAKDKQGPRATNPSSILRNTGAEARLAIGVVIFFVITFMLVIGMKLLQERRATLADAVLTQAFSATNMAEQVHTKLTDIKSYTDAFALSLDAIGMKQRDTLARKFSAALIARPTVSGVLLFTPNGRVQVSKGKIADPVALWAEIPPWVVKGKATTYWLRSHGDASQIYILAPIGTDSQSSLVAIAISGSALIPSFSNSGVQTLLVDRSGALVAMGNADTPSALLARLRLETTEATTSTTRASISGFQFRNVDGDRLIVGTSSLIGGMLTVYRVKALNLNTATWKRTLTFFVLMTIAPLLVAAVLCVILLFQMDTLHVARQALTDSEKRFRLAIEGARSGVWDWDLSSNSVFVTDSLARMLGWKKGATVPVSKFLDLVHPDDQENLLAAMKNAPETGMVDTEFRPANLPIWLHARGRPWRDDNDTTSSRVVGVAIEITEQKGAQARINAAENRLRAALESMSESFVVWDVKRRLIMCNRKFSDFFRIESALLRPGTSYEVLERAAEGAIKAMHEGMDENAVELELADGRWVHLSERPTRDGGLVSIGTDITALKTQEKLLLRKEKDLQETIKNLESGEKRISELANSYQQEKIRAIEANSSKSEFLANMSHELRTPLNAINGFSEIMKNEMYGPLGDARYKEYVCDILDSGQHLLTLINDILDMSKIEAGKLSLQIETVYADELIEQCVRILRGRAVENGLALEVAVEEIPEIEADSRAIKQVLLNLVSNAIKFTPKGGTVTVEAKEENGGLRIEVTDTGIGIPEEHLPLICKPFVQVENQHAKSHKGSGLGLALSQSLVHLHGGQFEITSTLDVGTKVSVWLPPIAKKYDDDAPSSIWSMAKT